MQWCECDMSVIYHIIQCSVRILSLFLLLAQISDHLFTSLVTNSHRLIILHFNCPSTPSALCLSPSSPSSDLSFHSAVMSVLQLQACLCSLLILPFSSRAIQSTSTQRLFQNLIKHSWCRCATLHLLSFSFRYAHAYTHLFLNDPLNNFYVFVKTSGLSHISVYSLPLSCPAGGINAHYVSLLTWQWLCLIPVCMVGLSLVIHHTYFNYFSFDNGEYQVNAKAATVSKANHVARICLIHYLSC